MSCRIPVWVAGFLAKEVTHHFGSREIQEAYCQILGSSVETSVESELSQNCKPEASWGKEALKAARCPITEGPANPGVGFQGLQLEHIHVVITVSWNSNSLYCTLRSCTICFNPSVLNLVPYFFPNIHVLVHWQSLHKTKSSHKKTSGHVKMWMNGSLSWIVPYSFGYHTSENMWSKWMYSAEIKKNNWKLQSARKTKTELGLFSLKKRTPKEGRRNVP